MKKAQTQQIFIFLFIGIVVSLTIVFGYKYIKNITKQGEELSLTLFQEDLQTKINAVAQNYGEVDIVKLELPKKYEIICFVDESYINGEELNSDYPLIDSSVNSGVKDNVFIGKEAKSFEASNLEIEQGILCIENTAGSLNLRIEGLGNKAKISENE